MQQQQQQQQQFMQMQQQQQPNMAGGFTTTNITTDHIQQFLDENKSLILKILENQSSGKAGECAENQARLQRNLMFLAAIADCQPQPGSMYTMLGQGKTSILFMMYISYAHSSDMVIMQPGANYMQNQHSQQIASQSLMAARSPMMYGQQQQQQLPYSALQTQQAFHSQLGISCGVTSGISMPQSDASVGGGGGTGVFPEFSRGITVEGSAGSAEIQGSNPRGRHGAGKGETG
ncbi:hypothetical protein RJ640_019632 [Escallonia rubra]|uniref:SS18 N-terminal domain-containing protein n=1 Tax=Escallonia rubra TaxID=112253 RepID=A0AA88QRI4_9ASTE|nr:hypothetical protein RJ640_019632 [Escallonia rubra]